MIPNSIRKVLENELNVTIQSEESVSGGSINRSHKLQTDQGQLFLKWNRSIPEDFFEIEARGLELLKDSGTNIIIPSVVATHRPEAENPGFLLMDFISQGSGQSSDSFSFGASLAKLHNTTGDFFGLSYDNYIGSLPQKNGRYDNWIDFFVEKRINPQLKIAVDSGKFSGSLLNRWDLLSKELANLLPPTNPSLIHGDLWGGNYFFNKNGESVLIDPAVYYGHPEMDLSFTKMFGGFQQSFYEGYESVNPIEKGFSGRISIYNMYPLLVHVNLFGGHYVSQFENFLKKY